MRNILDFQQDFPDARVIKLEQNYRSTETILAAANAVIANNRGGIAKRLWSDLGTGAPIELRELDDEHTEARFVVGEIERLVDEGASRSEIAVLYRTNAMSRVIEDTLVRREIAYQVIGGTKFYERAEIKDAIAYLSLLANPSDLVSFTRIANSPRRGHRPDLARARDRARRRRSTSPVWDAAARARAASPAWPPPRSRRCGASWTRWPSCASWPRARPVAELIEALLSRSGYLEALEAERTIEAAGPDREPRAAGRGGPRVRRPQPSAQATARGGRTLGEVPAADRARRRRRPAHRRRGPRDADDAAQRQGPRVPDRVHRRLRGRRVPALARRRGGRPGGGAAPVLRRRDARDAPLYLTYARRRALFGAQSYGLRSRFLDEIPAELLHAPGRAAAARRACSAGRASLRGGVAARASARAAGAAAGTPARAAPRRRRAAPRFRLGEDIVHAAFGDGVVTGVEPGGVIVVRFAGDGSERKLMADYAPAEPPLSHRRPAARAHSICADEREDHRRQGGRRAGARRRSRRRSRSSSRATGRRPGLATVLVGDDPGLGRCTSAGKQRACARGRHAGLRPAPARRRQRRADRRGAAGAERATTRSAACCCSCRSRTGSTAPALTALIGPAKDVDGLTPVNAGLLVARAARPAPVHAAGRDGAAAPRRAPSSKAPKRSSSGRSNLFGKPMAQLLLEANATVTTCHSRTRDLRAVCARAEILIVAVGRPRLIKRDFVAPGAVVIDVGMNRLTPEEAGNKSGLVGDVDFAAAVARSPRRSRRFPAASAR